MKEHSSLTLFVTMLAICAIGIALAQFLGYWQGPICHGGPFLRDGGSGQIVCPEDIKKWLEENVSKPGEVEVVSATEEKFPWLSTLLGAASVIILIAILTSSATPQSYTHHKTKKNN